MRIEHLSKSYAGSPVLADFTLELAEGNVYALLGASGSGKTTLLHILMGLIPPDGGMISGISGKHISAVFQEDRLFGFLTAAENIAAVRPGGSIRDKGLIDGLNKYLAEILPEESLNKKVAAYSGGMKRRVSIARCVLAQSDVLVMDEPFSGLDEETKGRTAAFIQKYRAGRTLIFSTHDSGDAALLQAEKIFLCS